jgi:thioredoxin-related protein
MRRAVLFTLLCLSLGGCFDGKVEAKLVKEVELNQTADGGDGNHTKSGQTGSAESRNRATEDLNREKEMSKSGTVKPFRPSKELQKSRRKQELMSRFYQIFNDGAKIDSNGKNILLVFGQKRDPYTERFKRDVVEDSNLSKAIRDNLSPFYIDATELKMHKFWHNGELIDVDTKTLVSIYGINSTPTIIFLDKDAKSIFTVPGYMPPKQFIVTINFIKSGRYKGKNRKNGEVYEELKKFYIENGVEIKGKR